MLLLGEVWSWSCTKIMDRSKAVLRLKTFVDIGKEVLGWKNESTSSTACPESLDSRFFRIWCTFIQLAHNVLRITRWGLQPQGVLPRWVRRYVTISFGCVDLFGDEIADMVRTWVQMARYSPWSAADSLQDSLSTLRTPTLGLHWKEHAMDMNHIRIFHRKVRWNAMFISFINSTVSETCINDSCWFYIRSSPGRFQVSDDPHQHPSGFNITGISLGPPVWCCNM